MLSMKYSVRAEESGAVVLASDLEGFFIGHDSFDDYGALLDAGNPRFTFRLVRPMIEAPPEILTGGIEVLVLDADGQPMGRYSLWDAKPISGGAPEFMDVS